MGFLKGNLRIIWIGIFYFFLVAQSFTFWQHKKFYNWALTEVLRKKQKPKGTYYLWEKGSYYMTLFIGQIIAAKHQILLSHQKSPILNFNTLPSGPLSSPAPNLPPWLFTPMSETYLPNLGGWFSLRLYSFLLSHNYSVKLKYFIQEFQKECSN